MMLIGVKMVMQVRMSERVLLKQLYLGIIVPDEDKIGGIKMVIQMDTN